MRNSDWSSDVCSSDLRWPEGFHHFSAVRYDINLCNPVIRIVCIGIADDDVKTETGWALQGVPHDNVVYRVLALDIFFHVSIRAQLFLGIARTRVLSGKSVSVRVDLGGRRSNTK